MSTASVSAKQANRLAVPASQALVITLAAATASIGLLVLAVPLTLSDGVATAMTALLAMAIVFVLTPPLINKMHAGSMVGLDVNKREKTPVAELGGIAALFAFSVSLSLVIGIQKLLGTVAEPPFLAAISVFFMAAMIGLIDDISDLRQRLKAVAVGFAALPLMLIHLGQTEIGLPFGYAWNFPGNWRLLYWLFLVPLGVSGVANAMNMSAGYNGLETGQIAVVSAALLVVAELRGAPDVSLLVFGSVLGCAIGLYYFNRFPARVFIGDVGTLGLGAAIAAGVILGHIELYGLIAIGPAFYEFFATVSYGAKKHNGHRKEAYKNPIIQEDGTLRPPAGANRYTLAFALLSWHPMNEKQLVHVLLGFYGICGVVAVLLSVV
jgi:UDP-N-acetylglucosamine--dolichyl-phosphate N-acetylglucosaminephosphotransferase